MAYPGEAGKDASMDDLAFASATQLAARVRAGEVTSAELVELHLERIEAINPHINAVVTLDADGARRRAAELDAGPATGPLHGVPITIKDCFATAGLRTTAGTEDMADHVPEQDAVAVARLRAAGAVILGKTNLPEEATGQETANTLFGRTVNPWDATRTPGGSSGGAAAALAAGLTALELGSDSGGSIRQPAHFCGVHGHVPSAGLVPHRGHLPSVPLDDFEHEKDLLAVGPLARTADDLELALSVLAGADVPARQAWTLNLPEPPSRLRVGVWPDDDACPSDADVRRALALAGEALDAETIRPPFELDEAKTVAFALWIAGMDTDAVPPLAHDEWLQADDERRRFGRAWAECFERYDVIVCPVTSTPALPHDEDTDAVDSIEHRLQRTIDVDGRSLPYLEQITWNIVVGMAGLPATAAPVLVTEEGLPVGVQLVGRRFGDRTTIAAARRLEAVTGGFTPPPGWVINPAHR